MRSQARWITAAVAAAVAALAIGQASAHSDRYSNGNSRTVRCESINSRQVLCRVNTQGGVRIVRQISHTSCIRGRTWNYDSRGIWVSRGCRADFAVNSGRNYRRGNSYNSNSYYSGNSQYGDDRNDYRDRNYSDRNNDYQNDGYDDNTDENDNNDWGN